MTTVLVIDDEAPIRLLCRVNLEAEGMAVLEAADGEAGLEVARTDRPDVILLDVMMPGRNGWEVAEELLSDTRTSAIPIVFLTARAEVKDRARGIDLGGVDYVTKPFNPVELAPLVRDLLARIERGERDELRREKLADLRRRVEETVAGAAVDGAFDVEVRYDGFACEGYELPGGPLIDALGAAAVRVTGGERPRLEASTATTDARTFVLYGDTPAVCFGPRAERIHSMDERVHLPSMVQTAQALALFVRDWCGLSDGSV
jgi:CheY-like chemotaxis protein